MFYAKVYKLIHIEIESPGKLLCVSDDKTEWVLDEKGFYKIGKYKTLRQWQKAISKTMIVKLWCIKLTQLAGMQVFVNGKLIDAWYVGNIIKEK